MKKLNIKLENKNRRIRLLLDQCSAHLKDIDCFNNIKFLFLPKNTSVLLTLDLGIILHLKSRYGKIMCKHMVLSEQQIHVVGLNFNIKKSKIFSASKYT